MRASSPSWPAPGTARLESGLNLTAERFNLTVVSLDLARVRLHSWTCTVFTGTDGSWVFRGGVGHSLVIDPAGRIRQELSADPGPATSGTRSSFSVLLSQYARQALRQS